MGKGRERQIILKTDKRTIFWKWARAETSKKIKWMDENRVFLEGDVLEVSVRQGRWVLCHVPAGPRPTQAPPEHYFPTE
jgi:hypothetical protein